MFANWERQNGPHSELQHLPEPPRIAVVIPAFRAEHHIFGVLSGIPGFVSHVIVVDDCSPDDTVGQVQKCQDPRICLVRHLENQGVGGATFSGYVTALKLGADIIVKMDSDGQMDPAYLPNLIAPILLGKADYTKGNRFLHPDALRTMPLLRRVGNVGLSFLTKLATGYWDVFDPANGYTALHAPLVSALNQDRVDRRYFFESSMLIELGLLRAVVRDVYIPAVYGDEKSSLSERKALLGFPPKLLKAFLRRVMVQYFLRDFGMCAVFAIVGLLLSLFGVAFGSYHWAHSIQYNAVASTGTVMIAVLPLILGVQLLLQSVVIDIQSVPSRPLQLEVDCRTLVQALSAWRAGEQTEQILPEPLPVVGRNPRKGRQRHANTAAG